MERSTGLIPEASRRLASGRLAFSKDILLLLVCPRVVRCHAMVHGLPAGCNEGVAIVRRRLGGVVNEFCGRGIKDLLGGAC